ncbi:thiamine biosynthesis protein ThiF [Actinotalea sp.]|uniref:thiamine biosynthesis protein ThiF n=1 Tax=Actinotalea sp. TaxID=1872145 RepID=UPI002BEA9E9C|nr:thiamine biosynthesis protein ThiF [Actinotalea sp.]HQY34104.1 thiamine biosynthesis protein ThiF [Actinotalea sp.]HRA49510.1 thiamine biosynthesis protein ThiF [Actinotalea sp.]
MRLRAGLTVLWRGPTEVQVGTDPRWAVALTDLSPSAARALAGAPAGAGERELRAALGSEDVDDAEVDAVLAHLRAARLLVHEHRPVARCTLTAADQQAWALLDADGDPATVAGRRATARVRVEGLGRLGAALSATLATAGIGLLELGDPGTVTAHEVGFGGLTSGDVGIPRPAAVGRAVRDAGPRVRTGTAGTGPVDLVVLVETAAADPVRYDALLTAGQPHLSVVLREASVLVGPLVLPGRTACLRCVDLHRTDRDPTWPRLAAQLASAAAGRARGEETLLAATGAAIAAAQVLAHVDGRPAVVHDAALEVALPAALPTRTTWAPHRLCRCGAVVGRRAAVR